MVQLTLWQAPPVEHPVKIPIFRTITMDKLYVRPGGNLMRQWLVVVDAVLFTADGNITEDEEQAAYMIARHQGNRVRYAIWRTHWPSPYEKEMILMMDAGYAYKSVDTVAWKRFSKVSKTKVVKVVTYRSNLSEIVRRDAVMSVKSVR